ncbi:MAG: 2-amino-4-hydroxy-6-hydroxymethyldihydropteridine diphosphokinase [Gammaproteobacteria bacterium]|nr:2-amino-4-hydroxy-6-hydroxymethyldihydropteridine diphosphokinase [Gammaproteobacteria bacterium]
MNTVYISIGSNVDPDHHITRGIGLLKERFGELALSPVYRSTPVGFDGADFLNLVAGFTTGEDAPAVINALSAIEAECGRTRDTPRFGPRTLDLDLLLFGNSTLQCNGKTLPRKEILEYAFVLKPLADLAGANRHPESGRTFAELWRDFNDPRQKLELYDGGGELGNVGRK